MKSLFSIVLILVIGIKTFASFGILLDYLIHSNEITEKYCENKAKPILKCNGKCHLAKTLLKVEPSNDTPKLPLGSLQKIGKEHDAIPVKHSQIVGKSAIIGLKKEKIITYYTNNYKLVLISLDIKPPQIS
jgi:hypothetical protein